MSRFNGRLPRTYSQAEQMLGNKQSRTLFNNTTIELGGRKRINVLYHGNLIAAFDPNGGVMLTNSGWGTSTTRERLGAMAPAGVHFTQKDHTQRVIVDNGRQKINEATGTAWIDRDGHVTV